MGQSRPFGSAPYRAAAMTDPEFSQTFQAVIRAARRMSPTQVAEIADALHDIRRTKRRRVDIHRMIEDLR